MKAPNIYIVRVWGGDSYGHGSYDAVGWFFDEGEAAEVAEKLGGTVEEVEAGGDK